MALATKIPQSSAANVTQEDEADEFQSYCLPDFVLIQVLEEVEEELELVGCKLDLTDNDASNVSSLTQLVEDDCRDTTFEQDSAERKRLLSHVLQMRASLERYLNQKLARQPRQPRMLIQMIRQFGSFSNHPKNVPIQEYCAAMHAIRDYGNKAAHNVSALPGRAECWAAVEKYSALKANYEESKRAR